MPRPKKEAPNHGEYYEVKATVGKLPTGKPERKSFYSKISKASAKAQAEQYKIDKAVAEQANEPFVGRNVSFKEWAEEWLEVYKLGKVKGNTYKGSYEIPVRVHLIPYFCSKLLLDIKPYDVQKFLDSKSDMASESIKKMRACLWSIFDTAVENDLCYKNPVTKNCTISSQKKPSEKRTYSKEQ